VAGGAVAGAAVAGAGIKMTVGCAVLPGLRSSSSMCFSIAFTSSACSGPALRRYSMKRAAAAAFCADCS
jgi:hypothetical protein